MSCVLDASALVAFLLDEPGAEVVHALLLEDGSACYAHALNLCEVFYHFHRESGEAAAQHAIESAFLAGVIPRAGMDVELWQEIGRFKSALRRVSLADCTCLALARR